MKKQFNAKRNRVVEINMRELTLFVSGQKTRITTNGQPAGISRSAKGLDQGGELDNQSLRLPGENFSLAVDCLIRPGKIVSGIGKSGHLGKSWRRLFAVPVHRLRFYTLQRQCMETYIHQEGDPVLFLSNSGSTPELLVLYLC